MSGSLRWDVDGRDWPHREASRFVEAGGIAWHVQQMGEGGPVALLLHGTAASAHSWRDVMPMLAERFTVIAPDLPGHGFTTRRPPSGMSLRAISDALAHLLDTLGAEPEIIVGHSAGVAIALHHASRAGSKIPVIGFNPAITPFPGAAAHIFPTMAKLLFVNPFVPRIFAQVARLSGDTARFLKRSTGSTIDPVGLRCYEKLLGNGRHCESALAMMANWDLTAFERRLPDMHGPVRLVHARGDTAIPLRSVERASELLPDCTLDVLPALGHLAHEEDSQMAVEKIRSFAEERGIIGEEIGS